MTNKVKRREWTKDDVRELKTLARQKRQWPELRSH